MKVSHIVAQLQEHADGEDELTQYIPLHADLWRSLACTALHALRGAVKLDSTQSAAWDVVESLICGG